MIISIENTPGDKIHANRTKFTQGLNLAITFLVSLLKNLLQVSSDDNLGNSLDLIRPDKLTGLIRVQTVGHSDDIP